MTQLPHQIRQNPLTPELKERVANELGFLAAERDRELGFTRDSAYISSVGGQSTIPGFQASHGLVQQINDSLAPEQAKAMPMGRPTGKGTGAYR